ncbi:FAD/NAD(P)-binding oxidoreductase [Pseudolactococcus yaeyamensis]
MEIRIIGGSHAAIACATRAREEYPDARIVIYEKNKNIGFIAQSIPLYLSGNTNFLKMSSYTTISELENLGILVKTQFSVSDIDMTNKVIKVVDLVEDNEFEDKYDKLILATGSYPSLPLVKGQFRDKLFIIKNYIDAEKIKRFMRVSRSVIIIGGGAIGVEIAQLMNNAKIQTTLIHASDNILNRYLDKDVAEDVQKTLALRGIDIVTNSVVTDIQEETIENTNIHEGNVGKTISRVITRDGREFVADGVIYATGFRPNTFLAADQLELGDKGAIIVDDYMQTSHPDVFAVGDCSTTNVTNMKHPNYVPHVSDAIRQGDVAAINLLEPKVKLNKSQGTYKLNFDEEMTLCMTGLSLEKAKEEGFDCKSVYVRNDYVSSEGYFELWMIYERGTHKILGMQSKGVAPEIAAQADIVSLAIQNNATVDEIEYIDFYYKHGFKNPKSFMKLVADKIRQQEKMEQLY